MRLLALALTAFSPSTPWTSPATHSPGDADGDGYRAVGNGGRDCNDADASIHPGAPDPFYDGIDSDCDGWDDYDADYDGFDVSVDCDDTTPLVSPARTEQWYDGIDQDCSGGSDFDQDGDGYDDGADCLDAVPEANPGMPELCNDFVDNDCDGTANHCVASGSMDTWQVDATIQPGQNGVDALCAGDVDGDGVDDLVVGRVGGAAGFRFPSGDMSSSHAWFTITGAPDVPNGCTVDGDVTADGASDLALSFPLSTEVYTGPLAGSMDRNAAHTVIAGANHGVAYAGTLLGSADVLALQRPAEVRLYAWSTAVSTVAALPDDLGVTRVGRWSRFGRGFTATTDDGSAVAIDTFPVSGTPIGAQTTLRIDPIGPAVTVDRVLNAGDLTGDGLPDTVFRRNRNTKGALGVLSGVTTGTHLSDAADFRISYDQMDWQVGQAIAALDFDGDGLTDLAASAPGYDTGAGAIFLFYGPLTGTVSVYEADLTITGQFQEEIGRHMVAADFDGDGRDDLAFSSDVFVQVLLGRGL